MPRRFAAVEVAVYIEVGFMLIQENIPLAPLTTFRLGGPARFFVEAKSSDDVQQAVTFAQSRNLPLFVLGGGSNLVVADSGWSGLVLKVAITGIERQSAEQDGKALFDVGAGESWDSFVAHAVAHQLRRGRMPKRHPWQRRGHASAERRRVWPGGLVNHRVG